MIDLAHKIERGRVQGLIQDCWACDLRTDEWSPPKPFRGPSPNRLMILTDAPLSGKLQRLLDRLLTAQRLPNLRAAFVAHVICCRALGPIPADSVEACEPNLRAQLALCDPEWVLTLGAHALNAAIAKAQVTKLHGRPFVIPAGMFRDRWIMPTFHPFAAVTNENIEADISEDLSTLSRIMRGEVERELIAAEVRKGGRVML